MSRIFSPDPLFMGIEKNPRLVEYSKPDATGDHDLTQRVEDVYEGWDLTAPCPERFGSHDNLRANLGVTGYSQLGDLALNRGLQTPSD